MLSRLAGVGRGFAAGWVGRASPPAAHPVAQTPLYVKLSPNNLPALNRHPAVRPLLLTRPTHFCYPGPPCLTVPASSTLSAPPAPLPPGMRSLTTAPAG